MQVARINAITYMDEYGDDNIFCILSPEVDAVEYLETLNKQVTPYNEAIQAHYGEVKRLEELYNRKASFEEVTGQVILSVREPKYPAEMPKGSKPAEEVYPEIKAERERRARHNEHYRRMFHEYGQNIDDKIAEELKHMTDEIYAKWPDFKEWAENSYFSLRLIYRGFESTSFKYVSK